MDNRPQVMIFDLDGTLTVPYFDFDTLRAEVGIKDKTPILEAMESMSPADREYTMQVLLRTEEAAAEASELNAGAHEVMAYLAGQGIRTAIATRNSGKSVQTVLNKHGLRVDHVHTREDGPVKPSPSPVLRICQYFGVSPEQTWLVGDYLYDILSGTAAGARTVLFVGSLPPPEYESQADEVVYNLGDLITLLENHQSSDGGQP